MVWKDTCTPVLTAALFTTAKTWKQPKCPLREDWIKKMWYVYTMEYYLAIKKEWNNAICSNMDGPRDCHTEWSKTERDRLRKQTELLGYGIVMEFGKVMYTLLYSKWITNKDLLYSTWNSTQMLCANLDGRQVWGRVDTCICMAEFLCSSSETTATLFIGYTTIQNKKLIVQTK